jgi:tellurite resistance protein
MLVLAVADGELEDSEVDDLCVSVVQHPKMQGIGGRELVNALQKAWDTIEKKGLERTMSDVAMVLVNTDQRIDAVGMALSVAAADGEIEPQERTVLEKLQRTFNLTDEEVEEAMRRYS